MKLMKLLLLLLSVSIHYFLDAEGFASGTYVKVPHGYEIIDVLKPHDKIICYDFNNNTEVERSIVEVRKQSVDHYIRLAAHNSIIEVSPDQKFYIHTVRKWETIETIKKSPELLQMLYTESRIAYLGDIQEESDVYILTLDEPHNFFITPHDILVHNFFPIITVIFAFEGFSLEFLAAQSLAATVGSIGFWAASKILNRSRQRYMSYQQLEHRSQQNSNIPSPTNPDDPKNKWENWREKNKRCLNNKESRELSRLLEFKEHKNPPFDTRGRPAFKKGNTYITPDVDGHKGGVWKVFDRLGNRKGTYDALLTKCISD